MSSTEIPSRPAGSLLPDYRWRTVFRYVLSHQALGEGKYVAPGAFAKVLGQTARVSVLGEEHYKVDVGLVNVKETVYKVDVGYVNVEEIVVQAAFVLPSLAPVDKARHYEVEPYPALGEYHVTHRPRLFLDKTVLAPLVFGFLNSSNTLPLPDKEGFSTASSIATEGTVPRLAKVNSRPTSPIDESAPAKETVAPLVHQTNSIARPSNSKWSEVPKRVASSSDWKGFTCRSPKGQKSPKSTPENKDKASDASTPPTSAGSTPEKVDAGHKEATSHEIVGTTEGSDKNLDLAEKLNLVESSKKSTEVQDGTETKSSNKWLATEKQESQRSIPIRHHEDQELPAGIASTVGGNSESITPMNGIAESDQAREVSTKCQLPSLANKTEQVPLASRYCMRASELAFAEESFSLSLNTLPKKSVSALLKEKIASINVGTTQSTAKSSASTSSVLDPVDRFMSESPAGASVSGKGMKRISLKKQKADAKKAKKAIKEGKSGKNGQTSDQIDLETSPPTAASDFLEPVTKKQQLAAKMAKDATQDRKFSAGDNSSGQVNLEHSSPLYTSKSASAVERATHEQEMVSEKAEETNNGAFGNNSRSIYQAVPEPTTSAPIPKSSSTAKPLTNKQKREGKKERKLKAKQDGILSTAAQPSEHTVPKHALSIPDSDISPAQQFAALVESTPAVGLMAAADANHSQANSLPVADIPLVVLEKPDPVVQNPSTIEDPLLSQSVYQPTQHKKKYKAGKRIQARKAKVAQQSANASTTGPEQLDEEALHDVTAPAEKVVESPLFVARDQLDLANGDTEPSTDKGNQTTSEATTEILIPSPSPKVPETKQVGCHESEATPTFDDGSNEEPTVVITTANSDDHNSQGVAHNTGRTNRELQANSESAEPKSELEPFPDFDQAACDGELPRRSLPQGPLSMGTLKAWMDEEDNDVRRTEDLSKMENLDSSDDRATAGMLAQCENYLIEDSAPSKDCATNDEFVEDENTPRIGDQPVASGNLPSIDDATQTTDTPEVATHGDLHSKGDTDSDAISELDNNVMEEMRASSLGASEDLLQGDLEDHQEDSTIQDLSEEDISEPEAPSSELSVPKPLIEDSQPTHVSTQRRFYNPDCLLLPWETSWFSEMVKARESGDFDVSELGGTIEISADAQEQLTSTEKNPAEGTVGAQDQLSLPDKIAIDGATDAQDQSSSSEEIVTEAPANAQDQPPIIATENAANHQDQLASSEETTTEPADTDNFHDAVVQQDGEPNMLENHNVTAVTTDIPQPPMEISVPDSSPETLEEQKDPALHGREDCGLVAATAMSPQLPAELKPTVAPEPLTVDATPNEADLSMVAAPATISQPSLEGLSTIISEPLTTEDAPVEYTTTEEVSVEELPVEDMAFKDSLEHTPMAAESNTAAAAPADTPQPPVEENPSPVASPEDTTNQDTSATSSQNLGIVSALDAVNIVDVAAAIEQHPDDKFLLLSLILFLMARFTMLLLSGIGLRRRA